MIEQNYNLDTVPFQSAVPVVHVSQYDSGSRTLKFKLLQAGSNYDMTNVTGAKINGRKPDGTEFSYNMTISNDVVSVVITEQMAAVAGRVMAEVVLTGANSSVLGTANFIIEVEKSPLDEGVISDTEIPIIMDFVTGGTPGQVFKRTTTGGEWADESGTDAVWGNITGDMADQTDLNNKFSELNDNINQKVSSVNSVLPDSNGNVSLNAEDIPADGMGPKDVSGNPIIITDGVAENAQNLSVELEPIQDLHGYDHPWVGGAGKNLLPLTVDNLKALNTRGAWSGNSYTVDGIIFTTKTDNAGNVIGVIADGTAAYTTTFAIFNATPTFLLSGGTYIISGSPSDAPSNSDVFTVMYNDAWYSDTSFVYTGGSINAYLQLVPGTVSNLAFYPMLRLASETDQTFEPYSNICPISGRTQVDATRTGHNIWDEEWELGNINITTGENTPNNNAIRSKNYIPVLENTEYYFNHIQLRMPACYDNDKNFIGSSPATRVGNSGWILTMLPNTRFLRFDLSDSYGATYNNDLALNYPATFTEYEPYQGQSVTVQLGQTVYGGTVNFTTGTLTVKTANIASYNGETIGEPWWSSMDEYVAGTTPTTGAQVVYTLATPTTVSLTPAQLALLEGYNILTTDGDTINLRYIGTEASNVQFEIDEFETVTNKLISSIAFAEQSTAIANHAVGDYIMLNNRLCKVTAAIATGESIIVGTNASYTTVADELKAILAQISA